MMSDSCDTIGFKFSYIFTREIVKKVGQQVKCGEINYFSKILENLEIWPRKFSILENFQIAVSRETLPGGSKIGSKWR